MPTVSVVISAFNEEAKIQDCLKSVEWADEIILVDSSSLDKTATIAKKFTSKIFSRPNNPMLNINKNYGFSKAISDWILCLDADERISDELQKEIRSAINNSALSNINGYWIPRKNIIFGKWMKHTGWYPDNQLRLFRRGKGKFEEKHVHEMVKVDGETSYLAQHIVHHNFETVSQFLYKHIQLYAPNEAEVLLQNGYTPVFQDAIRFPVKEFLSRFFAREGYKDGLHGLVLSILLAFYHEIIFVLVWEKKGFPPHEPQDMLTSVSTILHESKKEIAYWIANEKIKTARHGLKRYTLRLKRKIAPYL